MHEDDEIDRQPMVQRVVSAAGAPRPQTTGASSVFALASAPEPEITIAAPKRKRAITGMTARCVQTLAACGPLTVAQLAEGANLPANKVLKICCNGVLRGHLGRGKSDGHTTYHVLPGTVDRVRPDAAGEQPHTGFKGWLERQDKASAEGRPQRRAVSPPPATDMKAKAPGPATGLRFGLFSDGALRIERAGQQPVELPAGDVRALRAYLNRVSEELS